MKSLLQKVDGNDFKLALLEWRNVPRADGTSPAQMFFGRRQRTSLPGLDEAFEIIDMEEAERRSRISRDKSRAYFDSSAKELSLLPPGEEVVVLNPKTNKWDLFGNINRMRSTKRSYEIELEDGRIILRNR